MSFEFSRNVTFGQYIDVKSVVHTLDPRIKMLCVGVMMICTFMTRGFVSTDSGDDSHPGRVHITWLSLIIPHHALLYPIPNIILSGCTWCRTTRVLAMVGAFCEL
jgi:hypothetical protein